MTNIDDNTQNLKLKVEKMKERVGEEYPKHSDSKKQQPGKNVITPIIVDGLIKLKLHRPFVAEKIKTCTIVRDIDRWFACFSCNNDIQKSSSSDIVGVDVGLLNWMMLSNGEIIDRPRFLGAFLRIKQLQRSLFRKKKGSRNREKARIQLAKSWRKVRLQRDDYCQKITTSLAKRFGKIVFEKLSIDKMVKNHNLAQSILDSTWYRIRQLAACKAEVIIVDPSNTTQRCSCCGSMPEKKIDLKVRVYKCSSCGLVLNRDHNAALEILRKGLEQTHIEKLPLLDKTSKLFRGSMKPTSFMSG
jgi:putative transposase